MGAADEMCARTGAGTRYLLVGSRDLFVTFKASLPKVRFLFEGLMVLRRARTNGGQTGGVFNSMFLAFSLKNTHVQEKECVLGDSSAERCASQRLENNQESTRQFDVGGSYRVEGAMPSLGPSHPGGCFINHFLRARIHTISSLFAVAEFCGV